MNIDAQYVGMLREKTPRHVSVNVLQNDEMVKILG